MGASNHGTAGGGTRRESAGADPPAAGWGAMVVHGKSPLKGGSRLQANLPPGTGQQPRFGPSPGQLARLVDYAPAQTFYGRAQGTMDNVHVSHFELRAPGASCAPHPALTLDPSRFSPAPRSPRTNLPHVRYNPCSGEQQQRLQQEALRRSGYGRILASSGSLHHASS